MWFRVSKPSSKASFLNVKGVMRYFVEHRAQIHSQHICFVQYRAIIPLNILIHYTGH